ncbi:hypothetical protein RWZ02_10890 [Clostridium butyricum]|uniref:hypothetical protein n=1 Tax=Clostridium butyricum TaxID=1492 RepID=UPI0028FD77E5|nr:hypothetical protein [Clostridium butyricum]MDU0323185.1 hypothetical protein [Clostridium butyricum]
MAISENKKRVQVTFDLNDLEIIQTISKKNRHTVSDTIAILIEKYLKPEYEEIKKRGCIKTILILADKKREFINLNSLFCA